MLIRDVTTRADGRKHLKAVLKSYLNVSETENVGLSIRNPLIFLPKEAVERRCTLETINGFTDSLLQLL